MTGAKVKLKLLTGTEVTGRVLATNTTQFNSGWHIAGVGYIEAASVETVEMVEPPQPKDTFDNGAVLYAENNGFHHVWVKSGGNWYTANRAGTVSWSTILTKCVRWSMTLIELDAGRMVFAPRRSRIY